MAETTRWVFKLVVDILLIVLIVSLSITLRQVGVPFHRGFFCDDQSLMHPFKSGTVSAAVLYGVGFALPSAFIIGIESFLVYKNKDQTEAPRNDLLLKMVRQSFDYLVPFFFGAAVTHMTTNIPKYAVGRLRPHFFAICQPDWARINCSEGNRYITEDVCTGTDVKAIQEARVSFPSGHASEAVYTMVFLMIYLQMKLTWSGLALLRPTLQTGLFYMAFYTCLSRISDYKHHWSDVLAGAILGLVVALLVTYKVTPFDRERRKVQEQTTQKRNSTQVLKEDNENTNL
ncbi:phospholipid phosphatase 1-like isoform X1 [Haliotis rufescens]|uniref:phospholipid phosphatase 1-like isoform X1 n=2 Tax=Haliotis rufescens TaxID=6454 RepID=UPI00201F2F07|nr:phospholipid phosphatase 1-like isoform X1 [Haliotis rufescens]